MQFDGSAWRLARCLRRRAEDFPSPQRSPHLVGRSCAAGQSARRRLMRPGRSRSPFQLRQHAAQKRGGLVARRNRPLACPTQKPFFRQALALDWGGCSLRSPRCARHGDSTESRSTGSRKFVPCLSGWLTIGAARLCRTPASARSHPLRLTLRAQPPAQTDSRDAFVSQLDGHGLFVKSSRSVDGREKPSPHSAR